MTPIRRHVTFGLMVVAVAVVNGWTVRDLATLSGQDDSASHLLLVPFVTLALLRVDSAAIFARLHGSRAGYVWGAAGLTLTLAGRLLAGSLSLAALGLAVQWIGVFISVYGVTAASKARFALGFLFFVAPFPEPLLTAATSILKYGSTEAVSALFSISGTPFFRDGHVFALANVSIEVADECSGIRSSIALLMTSLLGGHLFLSTPRAKVLLLLAVLPITILKNGIRIVSLTLLAVHVDPSFLVGRLHNDGGVAFFLLALAMQVPVLAALRRLEVSRHPVRTVRASSPVGAS